MRPSIIYSTYTRLTAGDRTGMVPDLTTEPLTMTVLISRGLGQKAKAPQSLGRLISVTCPSMLTKEKLMREMQIKEFLLRCLLGSRNRWGEQMTPSPSSGH